MCPWMQAVTLLGLIHLKFPKMQYKCFHLICKLGFSYAFNL